MRILIYVPVIHTSADLGSLAKNVAKRGIADLGEDIWAKHIETVEKFWDIISDYFDSQDVSGVTIYQDGLVADGEIGKRIVEDGVRSGSPNYALISKLLERGAILVRTEDFILVKQEHSHLTKIIQSTTKAKKLVSFIQYKLTKDSLLQKRDRFIAKRIDETLSDGQTAILFIGAYHNIKTYLAKDIHTKELKDVEKVREYHKLLPFYAKNKQRIKELGEYITSPILMKAE